MEQTQQTQQRVRRHKSFGLRVDTVQQLRELKYKLGYRTYGQLIESLYEAYKDVDLAKVEIDERRDLTGHIYVTVSTEAYEKLLQIKQKYGYTFDTILRKLLLLKREDIKKAGENKTSTS